MRKPSVKARQGFTLLELLVVVAILAVLGGAMLVSYDGLEESAASAHAGFNIAASDRAVRSFKSINKVHPDDWDSLMTGDGSVSPFAADDLLDRLSSDLTARLTTSTLAAGEVTALSAIGISTTRDIDTDAGAANTYNDDDDFTNDSVTVPNRLFDDNTASTGFYGTSRTLVTGDEVAIVDSATSLFTLLGFSGSEKLVALGMGNNNTIGNPSNQGSVSQTPFASVQAGEYGRFIALYQVADSAGTALNEARFVGVIDPKGNILDEAVADFTEGN